VAIRTNVKPETIVAFRTERGTYELVNAGWPKLAQFPFTAIERFPYLRMKNGHIDVKLTGARGIYRITTTDIPRGLLIGELVYEEQAP
jgi:hypothetical protein